MMPVSPDVPFVSRTSRAILFGDTIAELVGVWSVVIRPPLVLVKSVLALHLVRLRDYPQIFFVSNASQSRKPKRELIG